jgi:hypothetical protein
VLARPQPDSSPGFVGDRRGFPLDLFCGVRSAERTVLCSTCIPPMRNGSHNLTGNAPVVLTSNLGGLRCRFQC